MSSGETTVSDGTCLDADRLPVGSTPRAAGTWTALARRPRHRYSERMKYVALLRGVNVGGAGTIDMKTLKAVFETAGMTSVRTYINSGNVVFEAAAGERAGITRMLEDAIAERFDFAVPVLVRSADELASIVEALPDDWTNDDAMKCDVFFLWDEADRPAVLEQLDFDPALEDVRYTPGAVIRRVDRKNASRSRLTKIVGTPLYRQMTVRNCNTARKLLELLRA